MLLSGWAGLEGGPGSVGPPRQQAARALHLLRAHPVRLRRNARDLKYLYTVNLYSFVYSSIFLMLRLRGTAQHKFF